MTTLFVYGSLRRGEVHHEILARSRFLGDAVTAAKYTLRALGLSPGMAENGQQAVVGELYEVREVSLARLDRLAGVPSLHTRAAVELADGASVESYLVPERHIAHCVEIPGGDWVAWRRTNHLAARHRNGRAR
jgi:gamma-glutamylcyclotransferase (GGCT)/AIG2-like uncharacterized protein YtfP